MAARATAAAARKGHDDIIEEALKSGKVVLQSRGLTAVPSALFSAGSTAEKWWLVEPLKLLDLSFNAITRLPPELRQFNETLTVLRLAGNGLTSLPVELFECAALKTLDVSKNKLEALPEELNRLGGLVELDLSANVLTYLPPLTGLRQLELLRVRENRLSELPDTLDCIPRLLEVDASRNALRRLPETLGSLGRLRMLNVSDNALMELPLSVRHLIALQTLNAGQNALTVMPYLPDADALTDVLLGTNSIPELPPAHVVRSSVATLILSNNKVTALPEEMRLMRALHTLDLSNNDLQTLPAWLGFMPQLARLQVDGNALRTMRRTLISSGTPSLKAYLKTRATGDEELAWERELNGGPVASAPAAPTARAVAPSASAEPPVSARPGMPAAAALLPSRTDIASAVQAHATEVVDAVWTHALRDAAATGRCVVPSASKRLSHVTMEALSGGRLDMLPRLRALVLDGHAFAEEDALPEGLQLMCPVLAELSLIGNGLKRIPRACLRPSPAALAALRTPAHGLRVLRLARNSLTDEALSARLPVTIEELDLTGNALKRLPGSLAYLRHLRVLQLGENDITLPEPSAQDTPTPDDGALYIPSLETLDMHANHLRRVPLGVLALPKLSSLNVADNEIPIIPPHLACMSSLNALNVEGNPQRSIRFALTQKGAAAVLDYLRSRVPPGTEDMYAAMYEHTPPPRDVDTESAPAPDKRPYERARSEPVILPPSLTEPAAPVSTPYTAREAAVPHTPMHAHPAADAAHAQTYAPMYMHQPYAYGVPHVGAPPPPIYGMPMMHPGYAAAFTYGPYGHVPMAMMPIPGGAPMTPGPPPQLAAVDPVPTPIAMAPLPPRPAREEETPAPLESWRASTRPMDDAPPTADSRTYTRGKGRAHVAPPTQDDAPPVAAPHGRGRGRVAPPTSDDGGAAPPPAPAAVAETPEQRLADVQAQIAELTGAMDRGALDKSQVSAARRQLTLLRSQEMRLRAGKPA